MARPAIPGGQLDGPAWVDSRFLGGWKLGRRRMEPFYSSSGHVSGSVYPEHEPVCHLLAPGCQRWLRHDGIRDPVLISCRWQDTQVLFRDSKGREVTSSSVVYPDRRLAIR